MLQYCSNRPLQWHKCGGVAEQRGDVFFALEKTDIILVQRGAATFSSGSCAHVVREFIRVRVRVSKHGSASISRTR